MSLARRNFLKLSSGVALAGVATPYVLRSASAQAPQFTLKLQQQLPAAAPVPRNFLAPWAQKVEKESGGRIKIELYPSMQLGGTPPQVFDQVRDGVIEVFQSDVRVATLIERLGNAIVQLDRSV